MTEASAPVELGLKEFAAHINRSPAHVTALKQAGRLVLADASTAADKGKLRALPAAAGTYTVRAIAREAGVDTQHVLVEAVSPFTVTVS